MLQYEEAMGDVGVGSIMGKGHDEGHGEGQLGTTEGKLPMTPRRRGAKPERSQNC